MIATEKEKEFGRRGDGARCRFAALNTFKEASLLRRDPVLRHQTKSILGAAEMWIALTLLIASSQSSSAQDGNWVARAPMPEAREGQATGVINGLLYVAGGAHNENELSTFEAYDPVANTWTAKAPMPTPREHLGAGVVNGILYVLGGVTVSGAVADVDAYDPATNTWSSKAPMLTLRTDFSVVVVNNILYAIGGYDGTATGNARFKDIVEAYDPATNTWTTRSSMPAPRAAAAIGIVYGRIYLAAGFGVDFAPTGPTYAYDPATDAWTTLASIPTLRQGNPLGGVINGIFYVAGGSVDTVLATVEAYDPLADSWSVVSPMPTARIYLSGAVVGNTFYAIGGSTSGAFASSHALANNEAFTPGPVTPPPPGVPVITNPLDLHLLDINEAFDPISNTWSARAPMPTARSDPAVAEAGGKIYAIGGEIYNNCAPDGTVEAYDPATDTWATKTPMLSPHRWNAFAATLNGIIYVVGGQGPDGCGVAVSTVEAFDPAGNGGMGSWSTRHAMSSPRAQVGLAVIYDNDLNHDVLYAIGGFGLPNNHPNPPVNTVERYDPDTDTWTLRAPLNVARRFPNVAVVGGKIYAIGGYDNNPGPGGQGPDTVEEYDPASDTWVFKTSPIPVRRSGLAGCAVLNGEIYVVGGGDGSGVLAAVEAYDPSRDGLQDAWTIEPPLPTARTSLGAAVVNNILYAIGGASDGAATVGQQFIYQITATNHPIMSYSASGLPNGLNFDNNLGIISGTPTTSFDFHPTFMATNAIGTGSKTIRLYVRPAPPPGPEIVSSTAATGRTGQPFTFQVLTTNTTSSARFTAGGLPYNAGVAPLTIDPATGLISGTPTSDGTFGVTLGVTDGAATASATLQLTFVSDQTVPIITSPDSKILIPGQPVLYTMTADAAGNFSYIGTDGIRHHGPGSSTAGLPSGLSFDGVDTISGMYTGGSNGRSENGMVTSGKIVSAPVGGRAIQPDTIKIRPPSIPCNIVGDNLNGTGLNPLNFLLGYTITADASPDEGGTLSGGYDKNGSSVTLTATPNSSYKFVNWTENSQVQSTSLTYTFTPTSDRALVANFMPRRPRRPPRNPPGH
jgi:N-acetylneuraminic acid mutarotase